MYYNLQSYTLHTHFPGVERTFRPISMIRNITRVVKTYVENGHIKSKLPEHQHIHSRVPLSHIFILFSGSVPVCPRGKQGSAAGISNEKPVLDIAGLHHPLATLRKALAVSVVTSMASILPFKIC